MTLQTVLVRKRAKDAKRRRIEAQCEPGARRQLFLSYMQGAAKQRFDFWLFSGYCLQANDHCEVARVRDLEVSVPSNGQVRTSMIFVPTSTTSSRFARLRDPNRSGGERVQPVILPELCASPAAADERRLVSARNPRGRRNGAAKRSHWRVSNRPIFDRPAMLPTAYGNLQIPRHYCLIALSIAPCTCCYRVDLRQPQSY